MKTQYYTASSLDGYIATLDDSLEWLFPLGDIEDTGYPEFVAGVGALAMGSATYEWMLRHAVNPAEDPAAAWPYAQPAWVFTSRELPTVPGADIRFVRGDVRPVHAQMRAAAAGRNVWIVGGGELAGQFLDAGLLDELIVQVGSVTLGTGKPLLPRRITSPPLRLLSARAIGSGFAELRYALPPAGAAPRSSSGTGEDVMPIIAGIADTPEPPYYAVIFTSLRTAGDHGYAEMSRRMEALATGQPGFLGMESVREGLGITVSYWRDLESIRRWKEHAEHLEAQREGREHWYSSFKVRIARVERDHGA
jgi:dihydrofolate reductase/heme-degrading monooxygenase HmoA